MSRATEPLEVLTSPGNGPEQLRRAEACVAALPQPDLEALYLQLPYLDRMVRAEIHARTRRVAGVGS